MLYVFYHNFKKPKKMIMLAFLSMIVSLLIYAGLENKP